MNKLFSILGSAALAATALSPTLATAQKLSPNAEIMLSRQHQANGPFRLPGKTSPETGMPQSVAAYVAFNDESAIGLLEELGISINSRFDTFVTADIPTSRLREVSELPGIKYVAMGSPVNLKMQNARRDTGADDIHNNTGNVFKAPYTGHGVIVGVIDTGLEYAHPAFRTADGKECRIRAVWNQNSLRGNPPAGFSYGAELTDPEAIRSATYDSSSEYHGSHTTGIAAGGETSTPYYGMAPDADIVFVSFDEDDDAHIADAIKYIFDFADREGKPCVINMSLGSHFGPHDGTSYLDQVIDAETGPGRIIVGAVGNEAEYKIHASKTFSGTDTQLKSMLTFNKDLSHRIHMLEIWGNPGTNFKVKACVVESLKGRVSMTTNAADTSDPSSATVVKVTDLADCGAEASFVIKTEISPLNNAPHASVEIQVDDLSTGRMIGIMVDGEEGQTVNIWNASFHELSSNGKSGWTDGDNSYTAGEIGGTANSIITVGSYDSSNRVDWIGGGYSLVDEQFAYEQNHRSAFSSMGPTADGRIVPHLLAPGMVVISAYNRHYFTMSGSSAEYLSTYRTTDSDGAKYYYGYNIGTSMAAPAVTGTVALMLEANPLLTPDEARTHLAASANTDEFMGSLPNNAYGAGRLNALKALKSTLGMTSIAPVGRQGDDAKAWIEPDGSAINVVIPGLTAPAEISVYNITGAKVAGVVASEELTVIDSTSFSKGVYLISVPGQRAIRIAL